MDLLNGCDSMNNDSLTVFINRNPNLETSKKGIPDPGRRNDGQPFYEDLRYIDKAYRLSNSIYAMENCCSDELVFYNSGKGSPVSYKPFPPIVKNISKIIDTEEISQYPFASGDLECRKTVAEYLHSLGFNSSQSEDCVKPTQLIFTNSCTEAFSLLMKVLVKPNDVVLFTRPSYGLFAYMPERFGGITRFIDLEEKDGWLINPEKLEQCIIDINSQIKNSNPNARVVAFININPNNPTGLVMGENEKDRIKKMSEVCKTQGVFLLDDIIYRDICYDNNDIALPSAVCDGELNNTITLFGLSKSYSTAGIRAGAILAHESIIRAIRNELFQLMDSTSLVISYALAGAFSSDQSTTDEYKKYFSTINSIYMNNLNIIDFLLNGKRVSIENEDIELIKTIFKDEYQQIYEKGIPLLKFAGNIKPKSGFFALVDFTNLKGKTIKDTDKIIMNEEDVLTFVYQFSNIKLLLGSSFAWPNRDEIVARMTFGCEKLDVVKMFYQLCLGLKLLK